MFAKVFSQIFDSSIATDVDLRHFFMDLLVLAECDGVVDMIPEAISARTRIPLDRVTQLIHELEQPDPRSRSKRHGGRRIVRIDPNRDWGWQIVNYDEYRKIASDEQRRERTKHRTRKWRETKDLEIGDAPVTHGDAGDAMQKQRQKQRQKHGGEPQQVTKQVIPEPPLVITATLASPTNHPGLAAVLAYFEKSEYSEKEVRLAFKTYEAGNADGYWMWGNRRIGDWRAAMESRMEESRLKYPNRNHGHPEDDMLNNAI